MTSYDYWKTTSPVRLIDDEEDESELISEARHLCRELDNLDDAVEDGEVDDVATRQLIRCRLGKIYQMLDDISERQGNIFIELEKIAERL